MIFVWLFVVIGLFVGVCLICLLLFCVGLLTCLAVIVCCYLGLVVGAFDDCAGLVCFCDDFGLLVVV